MLHSLPMIALVGIFFAAAAIVWGALSSRVHVGQALAGTRLLAVGTNLPEIAITSTAAVNHNLGIAVGNLLGGIAIQTVVLAALDIAVRGKKRLTYRAASITLVLETLLVVAVLAVAILGTRLAPSLVLWRITHPTEPAHPPHLAWGPLAAEACRSICLGHCSTPTRSRSQRVTLRMRRTRKLEAQRR